MTRRKAPYVGLKEIAVMLNVSPRTPTIWRTRSKSGAMKVPLPDPAGYTSGRPFWRVKDIREWAQATGRWPGVIAELPMPARSPVPPPSLEDRAMARTLLAIREWLETHPEPNWSAPELVDGTGLDRDAWLDWMASNLMRLLRGDPPLKGEPV